MGNKKVAIHTLLILLVAVVTGVSACAPGTNLPLAPAIAQATPGWEQVNLNGFGDPKELEASALEAFKGSTMLYVPAYR